MTIKREINGETVEIELTQNEMSLAYEEVRRNTWEACIRDQIDNNSENIRFTDGFSLEDFVAECMDVVDDMYYADDYDEKAEEIVFDQAESNDIWYDGEDDDDEV